MKKRLKKWMLPLFTLILVATGAAMPFIASYMQDAQQADPDIRPFDSFSLTLQQQGAGLGRLLGAIANGSYYINEASRSEDAALTQGLALAAVEDLLTELVEYGLLEKEALAEFSNPKVHPQTVIPVVYPDNENGNAAAVGPADTAYTFPDEYRPEGNAIPTWTITWDQPDDCYVWLDDASGKAVMIEIPSITGLGTYGSSVFGQKVYALAENWRIFLSDYYSTDVQIVDAEWYDDAVTRFILSFPLGTGEDQEIFTLDLYFYFSYGFSILTPYVS